MRGGWRDSPLHAPARPGGQRNRSLGRLGDGHLLLVELIVGRADADALAPDRDDEQHEGGPQEDQHRQGSHQSHEARLLGHHAYKTCHFR